MAILSVDGFGAVSVGGGHTRELWRSFAQNGSLSGLTGPIQSHGAVAQRLHGSAAHMVLSWYLPRREFGDATERKSMESIGQYYTNLFDSALHVAKASAAVLPSIWAELESWQMLMFDNDLPRWLADFLLNSVSYIHKTSLYFADGRWRHHESFSCTDLEPSHVQFFGSLPYDWWLPGLQHSVHDLRRRFQLPNGMIQEGYSGGCAFVASGVDEPNGREMGDVTSTYLLETYKQHAWGIGNGTAGWFGKVYPSVQAAVRWMINRTNNTDVPGLPTNLASHTTPHTNLHINKREA